MQAQRYDSLAMAHFSHAVVLSNLTLLTRFLVTPTCFTQDQVLVTQQWHAFAYGCREQHGTVSVPTLVFCKQAQLSHKYSCGTLSHEVALSNLAQFLVPTPACCMQAQLSHSIKMA